MVGAFFLFVVGLCVGSFLNVCISRLPNSKSIIFPASHCIKCRHKLSVFDLIPVLSYLSLYGKCRYCGEHISIRYPIVELLTSLFFLLLFVINGLSINFLFGAIFISLLVAIFFTDLETQIIPDSLNYAGIISGIVFGLLQINIAGSFYGIAGGVLIMTGIYFFGHIIYKKEALGVGDIKLAAMIGAFLGIGKMLLSILLSYLIGAVFVSVLLILKIKKKEDIIPFGPFMAIAAIISFFFGDALTKLYFSAFV